jgi:hypothetical protein
MSKRFDTGQVNSALSAAGLSLVAGTTVALALASRTLVANTNTGLNAVMAAPIDPNDPLLGRWLFAAIFTAGPRRGEIITGVVGLTDQQDQIKGALLVTGQPADPVTITGKGSDITATFARSGIIAKGKTQHEDILTGTFTAPNGGTGNWVASRGMISATSIAGDYNFVGDIKKGSGPGLVLDGAMHLDQEISSRPGFATVFPLITGTLNSASGVYKVTGMALGGGAFLTIEKDGAKYLALDTKLTKDVLEGTLYSVVAQEKGSWKATLVRQKPRLGRKWELLAKVLLGPNVGTLLEGIMNLRQDNNGTLTGTFNPKRGPSQPVVGQTTELGAITFTIADKVFIGTFDELLKSGASGTFSSTTTGDSGNWGIRLH